MKNKNLSLLLAGVITLSTLAPVASSVYANELETPELTEDNQNAILENLEEKESQLKDLKSEDLDEETEKNVDKLLDFMQELKDQEEQKVGPYGTRAFVIPKYNAIPQRIALISEIIETISKSTKELSNKVRKAQTKIGLEITKAVIIVVNPASTEAKITGEVEKLQKVYAEVLEYPDLKDDDEATIYVKAKLDKAIWNARVTRDKEILGKASFEVYNTLNKNITKAVGVWANPKATVAEVNQAIEDLKAALDEALSKVNQDTPEDTEAEETPVEPEVVNEF